jgi:hypothetical protein
MARAGIHVTPAFRPHSSLRLVGPGPRRTWSALARDDSPFYTAAMQSISMSKSANHAGTQTKIRAGGFFGK